MELIQALNQLTWPGCVALVGLAFAGMVVVVFFIIACANA